MIIIINNYVVRTLLRVYALAVVVVFCREIVLGCPLCYNYTVQQLLFILTLKSLMYTLRPSHNTVVGIEPEILVNLIPKPGLNSCTMVIIYNY